MTQISEALIRAYAAPVPRYTSYPTAPNFHDGVTEATVTSWLSVIPQEEAVSLYFHIPFCDRLCWFCGCHTQHIKRYEPIRHYLKSLHQEIKQVAARIGRRQPVARVHLGGGSPSMLHAEDLVNLRAALDEHFILSPETEISVEFDPTDMSPEDVDAFITFGVTRASLGVQDFDETVQAAINRPQGFAETKHVIDRLRIGGVSSVNIDALYGLPHQTLNTLEASLDKVVSLSPNRVAMFGYAHVPWVKPHQKLIPESTLPNVVNRFKQARFAESYLVERGYHRIGFDHFALADDTLTLAERRGQFHRNFQGYTADKCLTLIGFGTSAISQFVQGYSQNTKNRHEYQRALNADTLPTSRGVTVSPDDRVVAAAIETFLCHFRLDTDSFVEQFGSNARYVLAKCAMIAMRDEDGFFCADENGYFITEEGRPFVRSFMVCLDDYFSKTQSRFSLAV